MTQGPIIIVENDKDDSEILKGIFDSLQVKNELKFFTDGQQLLDYLMTTKEQPFLILSDVNMPKMRGVELRRRINENEHLRKKSVPFVFLSTVASADLVREAYDEMVQGYFQKQHRYEQVKSMMKIIFDYWELCKHPNNT